MTSDETRIRLADLGVGAGAFARGRHNAITDVPGVRVGHATVHSDRLHTGVTAIVPMALGAGRRSLPAGLAVGNGYGKLVGATQVEELGALETPVLLTSTLSVFRVADALLGHMLDQPGYEHSTTLNPVVGETNDGFLSDIRSRPLGVAHVKEALDTAAAGPVEEGSVGAGAGTVALGFKGGIGTSSRAVPVGDDTCTVGALVQSNFSGTLSIAGVPMPAEELICAPPAEPIGNSCMIVVATDAPLDARQLTRGARRAIFALRGVGSDFSQGSGDYAIAFSVGTGMPPADADLSPLFHATLDAVEEALVNSILMATTQVHADGNSARAIPLDGVRARLAAAGVV
ncbi:P1 family peptidase [Microbacterium kyungheense]|uniref:D-aminopeptidase n=1 Tax=Microbacterium kyungheense TaxID=1263636 RepID=A0A543EUB9_9MICO|nr:P1 family peptidase [Microbacterium kyungheense]TQM25177.1 D-aminopeptidase [Microbacterium kyungheense]